MKTYAIFSKELDSAVFVHLEVGDYESMETVREFVFQQMKEDPDKDKGYCESYPFFQGTWEVIGGKLDANCDFNQIVEIK